MIRWELSHCHCEEEREREFSESTELCEPCTIYCIYHVYKCGACWSPCSFILIPVTCILYCLARSVSTAIVRLPKSTVFRRSFPPGL